MVNTQPVHGYIAYFGSFHIAELEYVGISTITVHEFNIIIYAMIIKTCSVHNVLNLECMTCPSVSACYLLHCPSVHVLTSHLLISYIVKNASSNV